MAPFEGFTEKDFDAYAQSKWRSRMFNLERMEVKQKLGSLAKLLEDELGESLEGLEHGVTAESPSIWNKQEVKEQWLYFTRSDDEARRLAPLIAKDRSLALDVMNPDRHCRHACLAVVIDETAVHAGLYLHQNARLDRKNLELLSKDGILLEGLLSRLSMLTDDYRISNGKTSKPVKEVAKEPDFKSFLDESQKGEWLDIKCSYKRGAPILSGKDFVTEVAKIFGEHLLPLYRAIAWSRDNDLLGLKQTIQKQRKERKRKEVALKPGDMVRVTAGPFAGKKGKLESIDRKGNCSVRLGLLSVKVAGRQLLLIKR